MLYTSHQLNIKQNNDIHKFQHTLQLFVKYAQRKPKFHTDSLVC